MFRSIEGVWGLLLAVVLVLSGATQAVAVESAATHPGLELRDLDGTPRALDDLRGKIVVVNFWATWCFPCRKELPLFEQIAAEYADRDVVFVAASTDAENTLAAVPAAIDEAGVTFEVWIGATTADMQRFGVGVALPATAIIARDGAVTDRLIGVVDEDDLREGLDRILTADGPVTPPPAVEASAVDECCADEAAADADAAIEPHSGHDDHDHGHVHEHGHDHPSAGDASLVPS